MLEFAYTGEVNVAQDLLPSLLHTARSFRIKGLDKVESPVTPPRPHQPPPAHQSSRPPSPSHASSSSSSDVKPFLTTDPKPAPPPAHLQVNERRRPRSPESPMAKGESGEVNANRTPPPKRWKRSFDMTAKQQQPTQTVN